MKRSFHFYAFMALSCFVILSLCLIPGCNIGSTSAPTSSSGVSKMTVKIETNASGHTAEQENIAERYKRDNTPGSIKYLYVISPLTGDVLIFSSVKGKVSSSGKRLSPTSVHMFDVAGRGDYGGIPVQIAGNAYYTEEVLQDDGTYGSSAEYLYWFDQRGVFHQHYSGGSIVHISDQPLKISKVILNLEEQHSN